MAENDITHGELEVVVPWDEVLQETDRVVDIYRRQVRIPGFRPGKAPASVVRLRFRDEVRSEVLDKLINRHFWKEAEQQDYHVIGTPRISDVAFEDEEPLKFVAKFEMIPDFELGQYRKLKAPFRDPEVSGEEIDAEIERLRERHASYRNLDPRPLEDGDIAVLSLKSEEVEGAPAIDQKETTLVIGGDETLGDFTTALRGKSPGDEVDFVVHYPEDFGNEQLAGKAVPFHSEITGIRVKELPEPDDEFAQDVGDFRTLDELRDRIGQEIMEHKRRSETQRAQEALVDQLVAAHDFPVPDSLIQQQIRSRLERMLSSLGEQGLDPSQLDLDWKKLAEEQRPRAERDVKAGLLLERVAEVEAIEAAPEAIEAEVERYARMSRMTPAQARKQLAEDGTLERIESHLVNEKTLTFLFDEAEKVPVEPEDAEPKDDGGETTGDETGGAGAADAEPDEKAAAAPPEEAPAQAAEPAGEAADADETADKQEK